MRRITRRGFIKGSVVAGVSLALPYSRVRGANDDIRVAVVGFNGHGKTHISSFRRLPGVRVVALCDVDRDVLEGGVGEFKGRNEKVDAYIDIRKLLEDKGIDVVSSATLQSRRTNCSAGITASRLLCLRRCDSTDRFCSWIRINAD